MKCKKCKTNYRMQNEKLCPLCLVWELRVKIKALKLKGGEDEKYTRYQVL